MSFVYCVKSGFFYSPGSYKLLGSRKRCVSFVHSRPTGMTHTQTHQHVHACKAIIMNTVPFSNESVHRETKIPGKICLYSLFIRICIPIYPILSWPTNISTNSKYNFKIYSFYASLLHFRQPALEKSFTLSSRVCALLIHIDVRSPFTWN